MIVATDESSEVNELQAAPAQEPPDDPVAEGEAQAPGDAASTESPNAEGADAAGPEAGGDAVMGKGEGVAEFLFGDVRPGEGVSDAALPWLARVTEHPWMQSLLMLGVVVLVVFAVHLFTRIYVLWLVRSIASRIFRVWDYYLIDRQVFHRLVPIASAITIYGMVRFVPHVPEEVIILVQRLAVATIILLIARSLGAMYSAANDIYVRFPVSAGRPIKGYLQVAKILTYVAASILVLATLMGQPLGFFLGGLGAMTAIILLIFRETLLSLVAGMQLVNNDLVRVGDWISMPQFGADGHVVDIALNVVKVRNWDNTVTAIPTHKFLEHSFTNWRSMFESGGRRIQRAINLDVTTIRFLTEQEIRYFSRFLLLKDYIDEKAREVDAYNEEHCPSEVSDIGANARHLTNIGTFRAYVTEYLRRNPQINDEMSFVVRQLAPTAQGVPIEVYVFARETGWVGYEQIQSDIFDHLLSVLDEFGLRAFQEPSGYEFADFVGRNAHASRYIMAGGPGEYGAQG